MYTERRASCSDAGRRCTGYGVAGAGTPGGYGGKVELQGLPVSPNLQNSRSRPPHRVLGASWVVRSGLISRVTIITTHLRGLIAHL